MSEEVKTEKKETMEEEVKTPETKEETVDVEEAVEESEEVNDTKEPQEEKSVPPEDFDFSALLPDNMEEVLKFTALQMREWALVYMGLIPNPKHKKMTVDFAQSKMAIDTTEAIVKIIKGRLNEADQRELDIIVKDLKMNFISKTTSG